MFKIPQTLIAKLIFHDLEIVVVYFAHFLGGPNKEITREKVTHAHVEPVGCVNIHNIASQHSNFFLVTDYIAPNMNCTKPCTHNKNKTEVTQ
jgi:hypothetical protein